MVVGEAEAEVEALMVVVLAGVSMVEEARAAVEAMMAVLKVAEVVKVTKGEVCRSSTWRSHTPPA